MVEGDAPRIAGDARNIETYRTRGINLHATIRSYLGAPLLSKDGTLFGTLCAIDPETRHFNARRVGAWLDEYVVALSSALGREEARFCSEWKNLECKGSSSRWGIYSPEDWGRFVALAKCHADAIGKPFGVLLFSVPTRRELGGLFNCTSDWRVELTDRVTPLMSQPVVVGRVGEEQLGVLFERGSERSLETLLGALRIQLASLTDRVPPFVYTPIDAWSTLDAGIAQHLIAPDAA
jgi:hypothetical protein